MPTMADLYRQKVAGSKDPRIKNEGEFNVQYPSGFSVLDFINGCKINVKPINGNKPFSYYSIGITDGACMELLGREGCGKTTLAIQIAKSIVEPFECSSIFHDDIEGGVSETRKRVLTNWSSEMLKSKYRYRNSGITAENFYESLKTLHDLKMANYNDLLYDTGTYDFDGNRVYKLQPDVYILDSAAMLMPEKLADEDELSGQMAASAMARSNTGIYKRVIPMLKAANIILIIINHINDDINLSIMPKKAEMTWLKQGETVPGGKILRYLPNLIIKLTENTKLKEEKDLGINGIIVDALLCKSRTGRAGRSCALVFDYDKGFDSIYSMYVTLRSAKVINNSGAYFYINGFEDMKFMQKDFKEKLATDQAFFNAFQTVSVSYLKNTINDDLYVIDRVNNLNSTFSNSLLSSINNLE